MKPRCLWGCAAERGCSCRHLPPPPPSPRRCRPPRGRWAPLPAAAQAAGAAAAARAGGGSASMRVPGWGAPAGGSRAAAGRCSPAA